MDALTEALGAFGFGAVEEVRPYGEGLINSTWIVAGRERRYLIQQINTHVFTDPGAVMDNIVRVTRYLKTQISLEGGDPDRETLTVLPTRSGSFFHTCEDGTAWRTYLFVEGMVCHQKAETPEVLSAAGRGFGRFASRLDGYPVAGLTTTIPHFHDTRVRLAELERAIDEDSADRARTCGKDIEFALSRGSDAPRLMESWEAGELPSRVTHNDTKLNNVLIDPVTGRDCVIDLDTVMPGLLAFDFGDAIRYGASTAAEDEPDLEKVHFSLPLFEAYTHAYLGTAGAMMTPQERDSLAWGARLITYEIGMRFLTDYLQADTYYATSRPNQNLDRCRTQFALVAQMEEEFSTMEAIVQTSGT